MDKLLESVRIAMRISKTTAYDEELKTYIKSCLYELDRLGINYDLDNPSEEVITLAIIYVKSIFGSGNVDYKVQMTQVYKDMLTRMFLDKTKHTSTTSTTS